MTMPSMPPDSSDTSDESGEADEAADGPPPDTNGARTDPLDALTPREREILILVAGGHANKEIARRLVISERTARTHVSNILRKLGLPSRTQAALTAVRAGLVEPPQGAEPPQR